MRKAHTMMCQAKHVAVVGAGPAGLAAAIACRSAGMEVTVYERSTDLTVNAGTGVAIWPNGVRALRLLDAQAAEALEERGCEIVGSLKPDGTTSPFPLCTMSGGVPGIMIKWRALQQLLLARLGMNHVRLGIEVLSVKQSEARQITLETRDGDIVADLVIGADGVRSAVRAAVYGVERGVGVLDGGRRLVRAVVPRELLQGSDAATYPSGCTAIWSGQKSGATITFMDVGEGDFYWAAGMLDGNARVGSGPTNAVPEEISPSARELALAVADEAAGSDDAMGKHLGPILRAAIERTPEVYDGRSLSRPPQVDVPWAESFPNLTFVGDAMHAVVPSFGQGACLALEDAVVLGRHLATLSCASDDSSKDDAVSTALRAFESVRLPRTSIAQIESWKSGERSYGRDGTEYDHMLTNVESPAGWLMAWDGEGEGEPGVKSSE